MCPRATRHQQHTNWYETQPFTFPSLQLLGYLSASGLRTSLAVEQFLLMHCPRDYVQGYFPPKLITLQGALTTGADSFADGDLGGGSFHAAPGGPHAGELLLPWLEAYVPGTLGEVPEPVATSAAYYAAQRYGK